MGRLKRPFMKLPFCRRTLREERETPMVWSSLPVIIYAFIARRTAETIFQHYLSPGGVKDFFSVVGGGGKGETHGFQGGNGLKPLLNRRINTNPHPALKEKVIAQ